MFKKIFPYLFIFVGIWYLPETYNFLRTLATNLYSKAAVKSIYRVEVKVVKPLAFLPKKFAVLKTGEPNLWVELDGIENPTVLGGLTDDNGNLVLIDVPPGSYNLRVGTKPTLTDQEIASLYAQNYSVIESNMLLSISEEQITVDKDLYVVPFMLDTE